MALLMLRNYTMKSQSTYLSTYPCSYEGAIPTQYPSHNSTFSQRRQNWEEHSLWQLLPTEHQLTNLTRFQPYLQDQPNASYD